MKELCGEREEGKLFLSEIHRKQGKVLREEIDQFESAVCHQYGHLCHAKMH